MMRILTLGIIFFVLVASICVSQAVEPKLLWSYKADASGHFADVAVSADGEYVAAGSSGFEVDDVNKVYFFNREGELLWSYKTYHGVYGVAISADGEYIVAGSGGRWTSDWSKQFEPIGDIYFFNRAGELLWGYEMEDYYKGISISGDGKYVVTRYCDGVYFIDSGVITTPSPTSTPEHYEAIFAISGLLTVAYLLLRRRRDRAKRG